MRKVLLSVAFAVLAIGCGNNDRYLGPEDTGPAAGPCGGATCEQNQVCVDGACCTPSCAGKSCGSDGCGGSCGSCDPGWTCNEDKGTCECPAESDEAFCARLGFVCGTAAGKDNCGRDREVACTGACDPGWTCNPGTGKCECTPEGNDAFCGRLQVQCGPASGADNCGTPRTSECNLCQGPQFICEAGKTACTCVGEPAADLCVKENKECGTISARDRCNARRDGIECGPCEHGFLCNAQNRCEVCINDDLSTFCQKQQKTCGAVTALDNCEDSRTVTCGTCQDGFECDATQNCAQCPLLTTQQFCAAHNAECGGLTAKGNCNLDQIEDCGTCANPYDTCGTDHRCHACVPKADAVLCADNGKVCGALSVTDNCGQARTIAECGPCAAGTLCDAAGLCQTCQSETDAEFCRRNNKWCGTYAAHDNCNLPRTVAECGPCPGSRTCRADGRCANAATLPPNDKCDTPDVLIFDATGHAQATGNTTGAESDSYAANPCSLFGGADVIYLMHLTQTMDVNISLNAQFGSTDMAVLFVRTICDETSTQLGCAVGNSGAPQMLQFAALGPGDYYIWVDGSMVANGPFTLDVYRTTAPPPPTNDACASATAIAFNGASTISVTGTTRGASNDGTGTCATMNGGDVAYSFTLGADAEVVAAVVPDASSPSYQPAVYIVDSCGATAVEKACGTGAASVANLAAGQYYVIVDGTNGTRGRFTLTLQTNAPTSNDSCTSPNLARALTLDPTTKSVKVFGDTKLAATDDTAGSCSSTSGKDLVFSYEIPAGSLPQEVTVQVTPLAGSGYEPMVSIRSSCNDPSSEVDCDSKASVTRARAIAKRQGPGTYYVWVDTYGTYPGPFALSISTADTPPAPANDLCSGGGASQVTLDPVTAPLVSLPGTTAGALDDSTGTCGVMRGGDVAYTFTLRSAARVTARVERDASTPNWQPAVYLVDACPSASVTPNQKACGLSSPSGTAAASALNLTAGTYYVIVDGLTRDDGAFTLTLMAGPPMDNDTCSSPRALVLDANGDASVSGDTTGLGSDTSSYHCGGSGNDAVYTLRLQARKTVEFVLTPLAFTDASVLYVRTTCDVDSTEILCQQKTINVTNSFVIPAMLPNTTYYVWVDSAYNGSAPGQGLYRLDVHARDPVAPSNDTCLGAEALALSPTADGSVTVANSTTDATGERMGSCRSGTPDPSGGDVYYTFTLSQEKKVDITVTPHANSSLKPVVYLQSTSCGTGAEVACSAKSTVAAASISMPFLPAGTYYVVVDSYGPSDGGGFSMTVRTSASPTPPAEDICSAPLALTYDPANNKFLPVTGNTAIARDDYAAPCASTSLAHSGGDLAYSFTLPADKALTIKVTPDSASSSTYIPAIYVQSTCGSSRPADTIACGAGAAAGAYTLKIGLLPMGSYYLIVDGVGGTAGGFTLDVTTKTALAGENCSNPISATITPGTHFSAAGDTTLAVNDAGNLACAATNLATGNDLVYTFSTVGLGQNRVSAKVTFGGTCGIFGCFCPYPALSLRTVCNTTNLADELACNGSRTCSPDGITTVNATLPEGVYYLWVDVAGATDAGPYVLDIDLTPYSPPPANDLCSGATNLGTLAASGTVTQTSSTFWATDNYQASCGAKATNGGDVAYSFTLSQASMVTAKVTRGAGTYEPAIYLQRTCGGTSAGDLLACNEVPASTTTSAQVKAFSLAAGTYYLVVDGIDGSGGPFTLDVTTAAEVNTPENCASPTTLVFDPSGRARIQADTTNAANDTTCSTACNSSGAIGPDLVYRIDTTSLGTKDLLVTLALGSSSFSSSVLSLRSDCAAISSEVACRYYSGTPNQLAKASLAPGVYFLWVSGTFATSAGPIDLTVDLLDQLPATPANDLCATAAPLLFNSVTNDVRVKGATDGGTGDAMSGSCGTFNGPEVVYSFTMRTAGAVFAAVSRELLSPSYEPALHIRSTCPSSGSTDEIACATQSSGLATIDKALAAGSYYLVVDGTNNTSGRFDLYVSVHDAPTTIDDCPGVALAIDPVMNTSIVHSTTSLATGNTTSNGCNSSGTGYDVVYQLDVPAGVRKDVTADLTPLPYSKFRGVISMRTTCATKSTELGCNYTSSANTPVSWKWSNLAPGSYWIWVDSYSSSSNNGPFELKVKMADHPQPPANDSCTGSVPSLTFDASGLATVPSAVNPAVSIDEALNDSAGTCATGAIGGDVVYSFVLTQDQKVVAKVTPASTYAPTLYIRKGSCSSTLAADEIGCAFKTAGGSAVSVSKSLLPADTYYVWVDSGTGTAGNNWGTFRLDVNVLPPVYPPPNDVCAGAIELLLGASPTAGDASPANHDYPTAGTTWSTGCASYAYKPIGADMVYYYTPAAAGSFTAKVESAWDALLWYSTGGPCGDASFCGAIRDAGTTSETIVVTSAVAGQTYYFYVSTYSMSVAMGPFTIRVY